MPPATWAALKKPSTTANATKQAKREGRAAARARAGTRNTSSQKKPFAKNDAMTLGPQLLIKVRNQAAWQAQRLGRLSRAGSARRGVAAGGRPPAPRRSAGR